MITTTRCMAALIAISCCTLPLPRIAWTQSIRSLAKEGQQATVRHQPQQASSITSAETVITTTHADRGKLRVTKSGQQLLQGLPIPSEKYDAAPLAALLAHGWQEYNLEHYAQAKQFFLQATSSNDIAVRRDGEYGLLLSYIKLDQTDNALPLLYNFIDQTEQYPSTAPLLAGILFEREDIRGLEELLPKLPSKDRKTWREQIDLLQFRQDSAQLGETSSQEQLQSFLQQHRSDLDSCRHLEPFFRLAVLLKTNNPDLAKKTFAALANCVPEDLHWQERIVREQFQLKSTQELLAATAASAEQKIPEATRRQILQDTIWQRLKDFEGEDPTYHLLAQALYKQAPGNREAAAMAAWSCYQRAEYGCAETIFADLMKRAPTDDALLGLSYSLQKQGEILQASSLLAQQPSRRSPLLQQLRHELHGSLGSRYLHNQEYEKAAVHLEEALRGQPGDEAILEMLLWSRYHLGEKRPLVDFLWSHYPQSESVNTAQTLKDTLTELNDPAFTRKVMKAFAQSEQLEIRKIAGDYAFQQHHPVIASQIYPGISPYQGSSEPTFETMLHYNNKDGDSGTSKLQSTALLAKQQFSTLHGKTWSFTCFPLSLDSGPLPAQVPVGSEASSFASQQVRQDKWMTDAQAWGWHINLQLEGDIHWEIGVGSTPVSDGISPKVTGKVEGGGTDWEISFSRDAVKDSILSWIGQTDPYSGVAWGRVTETTLAGTKTLSRDDWWLVFEGAYGRYDGKHVEQNSSLTASISGGVSATWNNFEPSAGLFLFARGFEHNSNFYTFGHGGYYSPERQVVLGPFFRLVTSATSPYWFEASCSAGINYRKTEAAPHFTELEAIAHLQEQYSEETLAGMYPGESETDLGLDVRVRGMYPLSNGWFIGGEGSLNNVDDYNQWQISVLLRYRFGEGMGLGIPARGYSMLTHLVQ